MCLILLAIKSHPAYKLIIAANRDEYYERPTAAASFWADSPDVLAGKDLRADGTWLGITRKGRIAAITNYRDPASLKSGSPSRGNLVRDYLSGSKSPVNFIAGLGKIAGHYNGFNLIIGDKDDLYWYSNRPEGTRYLTPGIYGLSNHLLDTPWPKVTRGKEIFQKLLSDKKYPSPDALFNILADRTIPDDKSLPDTGVGLEWERILAPIFITSKIYGTRSSTLIMVDRNHRVTFIERTFDPNSDRASTSKYEFLIENT
jgi:uncharacterized protein with NRDE domain